MDKAQKGFTLIELVVVITILGILAAFAFPRFAALEVEARVAATEGLGGSIRAGAALAHSLSLVQGRTGAEPVDMEGTAITMLNNYPTGAAAGIENALQDITGFGESYLAGVATYETNGGTAGNCTVVYTDSAAAGDAPTIDVDVSAC